MHLVDEELGEYRVAYKELKHKGICRNVTEKEVIKQKYCDTKGGKHLPSFKELKTSDIGKITIKRSVF